MGPSNKLLVFVTGANQGIGYYTVGQLSASGKYHVFLGSRDLQKAKKAIESLKTDDSTPRDTNNIEPVQIDVTNDQSIEAAVDYVKQKYGYLDILMPNAGISKAAGVKDDVHANGDGTDPSFRENYQQQYNTNVFGAAATLEAFLPLLRKSTAPGGKRVSFTGSSTASLDIARDPNGGLNGKYYRVYRSTKTALNMVMVSYARELEEEGFTVGGACPGHCGTNLNNNKGQKDPRDGAKMLIKAIEDPAEDVHGYLVNEQGKIPW